MVHYFVCDNCGVTIEDNTTKNIHTCSVCGTEMRWDLNVAIHGNYEHPVHSDSLAIHPEQRAEHEKMFPDIKLDKQNRPIFDNFMNHQAYLDKCGLVKLSQKIKPKSN